MEKAICPFCDQEVVISEGTYSYHEVPEKEKIDSRNKCWYLGINACSNSFEPVENGDLR